MSGAFNALKVGDKVSRCIGGATVPLVVTAIDEYIHCGPWKFSKVNGAEVDEDLGWDENKSGSYIQPSSFCAGPAMSGPDAYSSEGVIHVVGDQHIGHDPGSGESQDGFAISKFGKLIAAYRGTCVFRIRFTDADGRTDWLCGSDSDMPRDFPSPVAANFVARVEGLRNYDIYVASSDPLVLQDATFLFRMSQ